MASKIEAAIITGASPIISVSMILEKISTPPASAPTIPIASAPMPVIIAPAIQPISVVAAFR